jgi:hypothetical protein
MAPNRIDAYTVANSQSRHFRSEICRDVAAEYRRV